MVKQKCLLCGKELNNLLEHYRFSHEIENTLQYEEKLAINKYNNDRVKRWAKYQSETWARKSVGEITAEEYRKLISKWQKNNKYK